MNKNYVFVPFTIGNKNILLAKVVRNINHICSTWGKSHFISVYGLLNQNENI